MMKISLVLAAVVLILIFGWIEYCRHAIWQLRTDFERYRPVYASAEIPASKPGCVKFFWGLPGFSHDSWNLVSYRVEICPELPERRRPQ